MTVDALAEGDRVSIRAIAAALKEHEAGRISKQEFLKRVAKIVADDDARRAGVVP